MPLAFHRSRLRTLLYSARSVVPRVYQSIGMTGWSCRFCPTPDTSETTSMPCSLRWAAGPMPETISSCGLLIAPPQRSTSRVAVAVISRPPAR